MFEEPPNLYSKLETGFANVTMRVNLTFFTGKKKEVMEKQYLFMLFNYVFYNNLKSTNTLMIISSSSSSRSNSNGNDVFKGSYMYIF